MRSRELQAELAHKADCSVDEVRALLDALPAVLSEVLTEHDAVAIPKLGTFRTVFLQRRAWRDPKNGGTRWSDAHHAPRFRPSAGLRRHQREGRTR